MVDPTSILYVGTDRADAHWPHRSSWKFNYWHEKIQAEAVNYQFDILYIYGIYGLYIYGVKQAPSKLEYGGGGFGPTCYVLWL